MQSVWRVVVTPAVILGPVAMLLGIVFVAILYPGMKAAWIRPIDAIHHR